MERCTTVAVGGVVEIELDAEVEADDGGVHDGKESFVSVSSSWRILPRYKMRR